MHAYVSNFMLYNQKLMQQPDHSLELETSTFTIPSMGCCLFCVQVTQDDDEETDEESIHEETDEETDVFYLEPKRQSDHSK